jgi:hypothetical protein
MIERIWRTLFDYVRAALLYAGAPKEWWDIALLYAAYVYNRASHSSLKDKSPIQVWTGVVADCSMFRTLFCPTYTLIPENQRLDKVSSRVQLGINFGPDQTTKDAWKIYLPHKKICISSRDCKFDEGWRKRALTILTPSAPIGVSEPYQIRYLPHSENLKSILVSKIGQPRPSPLLPKTVTFAPVPTPLGVTDVPYHSSNKSINDSIDDNASVPISAPLAQMLRFDTSPVYTRITPHNDKFPLDGILL